MFMLRINRFVFKQIFLQEKRKKNLFYNLKVMKIKQEYNIFIILLLLLLENKKERKNKYKLFSFFFSHKKYKKNFVSVISNHFKR